MAEREIIPDLVLSLADAARKPVLLPVPPSPAPLADVVAQCPPHWWLIAHGTWICKKCRERRPSPRERLYRDAAGGTNSGPRRPTIARLSARPANQEGV